MSDRKPLDDMTSDDLDQLYDRLAKLAQTIAAFPDANDAANLAHARAQRDQFLTRAQQAEAAITRVRALADRWDNALTPDKPYARDLRAALAEPKEQPMPTTPCTATISGPTIPDDETLTCTVQDVDRHPANHVGSKRTYGNLLRTDHHAGAVAHGASSEEP